MPHLYVVLLAIWLWKNAGLVTAAAVLPALAGGAALAVAAVLIVVLFVGLSVCLFTR